MPDQKSAKKPMSTWEMIKAALPGGLLRQTTEKIKEASGRAEAPPKTDPAKKKKRASTSALGSYLRGEKSQ